MPRFDTRAAQARIVEVCRFPIPKSALDLIRELKTSVAGFYPNTREDKVVPFLRKHVLADLIERGIVLEYVPKDKNWKNARKLVTHYYSSRPEPTPRKLTALYQVNFFYLTDTPYSMALPIAKDINLDLIALTYQLLKTKK